MIHLPSVGPTLQKYYWSINKKGNILLVLFNGNTYKIKIIIIKFDEIGSNIVIYKRSIERDAARKGLVKLGHFLQTSVCIYTILRLVFQNVSRYKINNIFSVRLKGIKLVL